MTTAMDSPELAFFFDRVPPTRLQGVHELLISWRPLFADALRSASVGFDPSKGTVVATARFVPAAYGPHIRARFEFWASRFGGRTVALHEVAAQERLALLARLEACPRMEQDVAPHDLAEIVARLKLTSDSRRGELRLAAALEVTFGPDTAATYDVSPAGLFVKTTRAPPIGDLVPLRLAFPTGVRFELKGRVTHVRTAPDRQRRPAGFGVQFLQPPPALADAVFAHMEARHAPRPNEERRAAVRVHFFPPAPRKTPIRVRYATSEEFVEEYVQNISAGGVLVKSPRPLLRDTPVRLELELPNGEVVETTGKVVRVLAEGMGIEFTLAAETKQRLEALVAAYAPEPMRMLIVDDDALIRTIYADQFERSGFDVLTASDGSSGLETLLNEMFRLDLVLSDVNMPGLDGRALLRVLREGGETGLAVVMVTGSLTAALRTELLAAGATDVFDKALGPELLCARVVALAASRRSPRQ